MSFCEKCGHSLSPEAKFCGKCGAACTSTGDQPTWGQPERPTREAKPRARPVREGSQEGAKAYRELIALKAAARRIAFGAFTTAVLLGLASYVSFAAEASTLGVVIAVIAVAAAIVGAVKWTPERLSVLEYARLPGALVEGGHQCISCGNRGIYRHTPYKTTTTLADCSRCKTALWHEPAQ